MTSRLYTAINHDVIIDNPTRRYVLKVRDLPTEEKPRERLFAHGPEALSTAELLAILLTTGTRKEEVLTMSNRIIKEYGTQGIMTQRNPSALMRDTGIPAGKAAQIVACGELGRRFFHKNNTTSPVLRTAHDACEYASDMRRLSKEHLRGIYLNAHYKIIHDETISIGTIDTNIVHPREVFKPALEYCAAAVILMHNHPSGDTTPSQADIDVTRQLVAAGRLLGIDLIDHIIITDTSFASIPVDYQNS
jgi:DNA repair protein RadC